MRQPKYQLRMNADLLQRLTDAGTTRVREALERAFPVLPGTDAGSTGASEQPERVLPEPDPVLPERVAGTTEDAAGTTREPGWKAKLREQVARAEAMKAARRATA